MTLASLLPQWIQEIDWGWWYIQLVNLCSVAGFFITIYVAWSIRTIQRRYALIARAPEFIKKLRGHADTIMKHRENPEAAASSELILELVSASVTVASVEHKLPWRQGRAARRAKRAIAACQETTPPDKDLIATTFQSVHFVAEELDQLMKDRKWLEK